MAIRAELVEKERKRPVSIFKHHTRSSDLYNLIYSKTKEVRSLLLNEEPIPGIFIFHDGTIHYHIEKETPYPCIELVITKSADPTYEEDVLFLYSYFDDRHSRDECKELTIDKLHGGHVKMFSVLFALAKGAGIGRIELEDNSRIILSDPTISWNLRILNCILKNKFVTWYNKIAGFIPYNKKLQSFIEHPRWAELGGIPLSIQLLLEQHKMKQTDIVAFVHLLHSLFNSKLESDHQLYKQLSNEFITLVDSKLKTNPSDVNPDVFYKDIHYEVEYETILSKPLQINIHSLSEGGNLIRKKKKGKKSKKSKKNKKNKRTMRKIN
jgi:hypothetical protein